MSIALILCRFRAIYADFGSISHGLVSHLLMAHTYQGYMYMETLGVYKSNGSLHQYFAAGARHFHFFDTQWSLAGIVQKCFFVSKTVFLVSLSVLDQEI